VFNDIRAINSLEENVDVEIPIVKVCGETIVEFRVNVSDDGAVIVIDYAIAIDFFIAYLSYLALYNCVRLSVE